MGLAAGVAHGVTVAMRRTRVDCRTDLGLQITMVVHLAIGAARMAIVATLLFMAAYPTAVSVI